MSEAEKKKKKKSKAKDKEEKKEEENAEDDQSHPLEKGKKKDKEKTKDKEKSKSKKKSSSKDKDDGSGSEGGKKDKKDKKGKKKKSKKKGSDDEEEQQEEENKEPEKSEEELLKEQEEERLKKEAEENERKELLQELEEKEKIIELVQKSTYQLNAKITFSNNKYDEIIKEIKEKENEPREDLLAQEIKSIEQQILKLNKSTLKYKGDLRGLETSVVFKDQIEKEFELQTVLKRENVINKELKDKAETFLRVNKNQAIYLNNYDKIHQVTKKLDMLKDEIKEGKDSLKECMERANKQERFIRVMHEKIFYLEECINKVNNKENQRDVKKTFTKEELKNNLEIISNLKKQIHNNRILLDQTRDKHEKKIHELLSNNKQIEDKYITQLKLQKSLENRKSELRKQINLFNSLNNSMIKKRKVNGSVEIIDSAGNNIGYMNLEPNNNGNKSEDENNILKKMRIKKVPLNKIKNNSMTDVFSGINSGNSSVINKNNNIINQNNYGSNNINGNNFNNEQNNINLPIILNNKLKGNIRRNKSTNNMVIQRNSSSGIYGNINNHQLIGGNYESGYIDEMYNKNNINIGNVGGLAGISQCNNHMLRNNASESNLFNNKLKINNNINNNPNSGMVLNNSIFTSIKKDEPILSTINNNQGGIIESVGDQSNFIKNLPGGPAYQNISGVVEGNNDINIGDYNNI